MPTKKIQLPKENKGYGYTGVWKDGKAGWFMPSHIVGGDFTRQYPDTPLMSHPCLKGERLFLCEITIKPLTDKKGRPITKIIKK